MKKVFLSIAFISAFAAWTLYLRNRPDNAADAAIASADVVQVSTVSATQSQPKPVVAVQKQVPAKRPIQQKPPTQAPQPSRGRYVDGRYTGSVADAYYGNLQVQAVIANGELVDVAFLQYPTDRSTSRRISAMALPRLRQEAIASQSASVHTISGATDVSGAFRSSLATALDQAVRS